VNGLSALSTTKSSKTASPPLSLPEHSAIISLKNSFIICAFNFELIILAPGLRASGCSGLRASGCSGTWLARAARNSNHSHQVSNTCIRWLLVYLQQQGNSSFSACTLMHHCVSLMATTSCLFSLANLVARF